MLSMGIRSSWNLALLWMNYVEKLTYQLISPNAHETEVESYGFL